MDDGGGTGTGGRPGRDVALPRILIAYDIPDNRRRQRVAKTLLRFGRRVQYSVFLAGRGSAREIAAALAPLIDPAADDVRIQPLCLTCDDKVLLLGIAAARAHSPLPLGFRIV